eukprot:g5484.t1
MLESVKHLKEALKRAEETKRGERRRRNNNNVSSFCSESGGDNNSGGSINNLLASSNEMGPREAMALVLEDLKVISKVGELINRKNLREIEDQGRTFPIRDILYTLQRFYLHPEASIRIMALRATRHMIKTRNNVAVALRIGIGTFAALSMQRPQRRLRWERVEALKLVQHLIKTIYGPLYQDDDEDSEEEEDSEDDDEDDGSDDGASSNVLAAVDTAAVAHTKTRRGESSAFASTPLSTTMSPSLVPNDDFVPPKAPSPSRDGSREMRKDSLASSLPMKTVIGQLRTRRRTQTFGSLGTGRTPRLQSLSSSDREEAVSMDGCESVTSTPVVDGSADVVEDHVLVVHEEEEEEEEEEEDGDDDDDDNDAGRQKSTTSTSDAAAAAAATTTTTTTPRNADDDGTGGDTSLRVPRHLISALVAVASTPLRSETPTAPPPPPAAGAAKGTGRGGGTASKANKKNLHVNNKRGQHLNNNGNDEDSLAYRLRLKANADHVLRAFSLELLRQLLLVDPAAVASCDGAFQVLWDAILQYEHRQLQRPLLLTILHVLGRIDNDFEIPPLRSLLWPLTTVESPKTKLKIEKARAMSSVAVRVMMRSWAGIWLLSTDPLALSEIVRVLGRRVSASMRLTALAIFESLIENVDVELSGTAGYVGIDMYSKRSVDRRPDLMHSYGAALLLALMHCGLTQKLVTVVLRSGGVHNDATDSGSAGAAAPDPLEDEFSLRAKALLARLLRLNVLLLPAKLNRIGIETSSSAALGSTSSSDARRRLGSRKLSVRHRKGSAWSASDSVSTLVQSSRRASSKTNSSSAMSVDTPVGTPDAGATAAAAAAGGTTTTRNNFDYLRRSSSHHRRRRNRESSSHGGVASRSTRVGGGNVRRMQSALANDRRAGEVVFRTFAEQLRKTRTSSWKKRTSTATTASEDGRSANGITTLAEMTVVEYDRQPGTVGPRDQLIVARLRSQCLRQESGAGGGGHHHPAGRFRSMTSMMGESSGGSLIGGGGIAASKDAASLRSAPSMVGIGSHDTVDSG